MSDGIGLGFSIPVGLGGVGLGLGRVDTTLERLHRTVEVVLERPQAIVIPPDDRGERGQLLEQLGTARLPCCRLTAHAVSLLTELGLGLFAALADDQRPLALGIGHELLGAGAGVRDNRVGGLLGVAKRLRRAEVFGLDRLDART